MPSRDEIKLRVVEKIRAITDRDELAADEEARLEKDLGMGPIVRKAMALPYTRIAMSYAGGAAVTQSAAGACKTVGASIDLVHKCANGGKS